MWNVRVVVEKVVEHGLQVLKYASKNGLQRFEPPSVRPNQLNTLGESGIKINGGQIVVESFGNSIASSQGGAGGVGNGVVSRLRPVTTRLLQGFLRKFSSPLWTEAKRRATRRLVFGETAPFFALVGVTLVSGSEKGFLTKNDEAEALCGNIRDAISRVGWLHNPEFWENHNIEENNGEKPQNSSENLIPEHVFSLADLELANVIDKGCNAVVYAAKWKEDMVAKMTVDHESEASSSTDQSEHVSADGESEIYSCSSENNLADESLDNFVDVDEYYTASDDDDNQCGAMRRSVSENLTLPTIDMIGQRSRKTSLTEDVVRLLSDGDFLCPPKRLKRVKFKLMTDESSSDSDHDELSFKAKSVKKKLKKIPQESVISEESSSKSMYPLAVKMMFNYEAASNAPAILSAMYKELVPARTLQLNETLDCWKMKFLSEKMTLPSHTNVVEMPCVFVDRVPSLRSSMELYPQALPSRLNPEGFGRNMSLFCVMRRYDISLSEYLSKYTPSTHTSLILFTQLLEATLHINNHNIAHRDMKSDNILLLLTEGWEYPLLVLSDFGCCIADQSLGLHVPFTSFESDPRQGNAALMAPEVKSATPGLITRVNYTRSDLWAAGTIAYEMFGHENPFMPYLKSDGNKAMLDSTTYKDFQVPRLPKYVPAAVKNLIHDILHRNPKNRPSPAIAATLCQLILWAPSKWLNRHSLTLPSHKEITQWLLCLTTKVLCEARLNQSSSSKNPETSENASADLGSGLLEYQLVSTLLSRVRYIDIIQAIKWNRSF